MGGSHSSLSSATIVAVATHLSPQCHTTELVLTWSHNVLQGWEAKELLYYGRHEKPAMKQLGITFETDLDKFLGKCEVVGAGMPAACDMNCEQTTCIHSSETYSPPLLLAALRMYLSSVEHTSMCTHTGRGECAAERQDARHVQRRDDRQDEEGRDPGVRQAFPALGLAATADFLGFKDAA
jgi:hypothetical protein